MKTKAELEKEMIDDYIYHQEMTGCLIYAILIISATALIGGVLLMNWIVNLIFYPA
jgi:hypothetical protein